jgi:hypothetical protein
VIATGDDQGSLCALRPISLILPNSLPRQKCFFTSPRSGRGSCRTPRDRHREPFRGRAHA